MGTSPILQGTTAFNLTSSVSKRQNGRRFCCSVILNQPRNYFSVLGPLEKSGGGGRSGKILLQHAFFFLFNGNFSSVVYATESHDTAQVSTQLNKF